MVRYNQKKEREVNNMTNITTINGYNAKNEIVATATAPYAERFAEINRIMDMPEVTHITTCTTIRQGR